MTAEHFAGMDAVRANYAALTPLSFLVRCRDVFGDREAVIYGNRSYTWRQLHDRSEQLAAALKAAGIAKDDVVSLMAANTPEMVEAHFGVPMSGAVLNTINTRLDPETIAYILGHAGTKLLITDTQLAPNVKLALEHMGDHGIKIIDIDDAQAGTTGERLGDMDYDTFLTTGNDPTDWQLPDDEWDAITLSYTSGTSGRPKGVVYHHRGSYLMALGTITGWALPAHPRYLYTVPLFHCNGWGHAWTMAACAGTIICNRTVSARVIFDAIVDHNVTHFGGAPVVLGMLVNAPEDERREITHPVKVMTAGAPPPAAIIEKCSALGMEVLQVYGLTETFGHVVECVWRDEWNDLPLDEQATIKARQGVRFPVTEDVTVVDVSTREPVPADGKTQGEITVRGNTVMKGYFRDPQATADAFADGAFKSGDIAVVHPNGYIEIKDRLKDVIISGGENISSVEVEGAIYKHPAVAVAAVVARPDEKWGETPCAFVELKPGETASEQDIIEHCRALLAGFKAPKTVIFEELPKTATGKIQKFALRERARNLS